MKHERVDHVKHAERVEHVERLVHVERVERTERVEHAEDVERVEQLTYDGDPRTARGLAAAVGRLARVARGVVLADLTNLQAARAVDFRDDVVGRSVDALVVFEPGDDRGRTAGHLALQHERRALHYVRRFQVLDEVGRRDCRLGFCTTIVVLVSTVPFNLIQFFTHGQRSINCHHREQTNTLADKRGWRIIERGGESRTSIQRMCSYGFDGR